jgi:ABC-type multidrug transport system ATPase subunit
VRPCCALRALRPQVNGFDKKAAAFARVMGYCEQSDVHSAGATVEEAVRTSAVLRPGSAISKDQVSLLCDPLVLALGSRHLAALRQCQVRVSISWRLECAF